MGKPTLTSRVALLERRIQSEEERNRYLVAWLWGYGNHLDVAQSSLAADARRLALACDPELRWPPTDPGESTEPSAPTRPILNTEEEDIRGLVESAARDAGIDPELLLAGMIAESALNPKAERWGTRADEAKAAIEVGGWPSLRSIIFAEWPDISFGYGQRIVRYHYLGDGNPTLENILAVRAAVFADPERDVREMAAKLRDCYDRTWEQDMAPVQGNHFLGALVTYNAGHYPDPKLEWGWWQRWAGNVASYRAALIQAREMLGSSDG